MLVRRWVMSKAALGVETDLRRDLYGHLQALPVSFHDRWQSGQLLSRATEDLATIRRFLGFGLVFLVVNSDGLRGRRRSCCSSCTGRWRCWCWRSPCRWC